MSLAKKYTLSPPAQRREFRVDYEADLNSEQRTVVMAPGGPMVVIAGAGSGKTRTVTYRVARLIESGEDPQRILLLTFTNKAAGEMLRRVEGLIQSNARRVWGGTFHHIGNLILRRHAEAVGFHPQYSIMDREDSSDLLNACATDVGINFKEKRFPKGNVLLDIISFASNTLTPLPELVQQRYPYFEELLPEIERVSARYGVRKREMNLLDFDDLLTLWLRLLREHPAVLESYQGRFRQVMVDEYQDTNRLQGEIVDLLGAHHRNLMVVGDDAQSIYSFRGADFSNIMEFPKRYPDAQVFRLETNYRSTPQILSLANESIAHNVHQYKKRLQAVRGEGPLPILIPARDVLQQADFVTQRILEMRDEGIPLEEIAVLYRAHFHCMELQMELTRRGIPFEIRSGLRFFEQRHIKDVTAHLKIAVNPLDEIAWKRILLLITGVGNATVRRLWSHLSNLSEPLSALGTDKTTTLFPRASRPAWARLAGVLEKLRTEELLSQPSEMIRLVVEESYEEYMQKNFTNCTSRLEDLEQLARFAEQWSSKGQEACGVFLSELALMSAVTGEEATETGEDERVTLSSVHQAKGLEWRALFIIWLSDGRFPSSRALQDEAGEEEERRLFYVAATRAQEHLYLCYPILEMDRYRMSVFSRPSRFLKEIPAALMESWSLDEGLEVSKEGLGEEDIFQVGGSWE